jgi:hypothetical protein
MNFVGPPSTLTAWVAADRAVKAVEELGLDGPVGPAARRHPRVPLMDTARTLTSAHAKSATDSRAKEGLKGA